MDEDEKRRRKTVSIYNERSKQYEEHAENPEQRTMGETLKEAFATSGTRYELAKARKRRGY